MVVQIIKALTKKIKMIRIKINQETPNLAGIPHRIRVFKIKLMRTKKVNYKTMSVLENLIAGKTLEDKRAVLGEKTVRARKFRKKCITKYKITIISSRPSRVKLTRIKNLFHQARSTTCKDSKVMAVITVKSFIYFLKQAEVSIILHIGLSILTEVY